MTIRLRREVNDELPLPPLWSRLFCNLLGRFGYKIWVKLGATYYNRVAMRTDGKSIHFGQSEWDLVNGMTEYVNSEGPPKEPINLNTYMKGEK